MAKLTLDGLKTFVGSYVDTAKQAGAWSATTDNLIGLQDKIGKQITIDGTFQDKLPELNGDDLPLGKTIEEFYVDLTLPQAFDETGANTLAPHKPTVQDVAYSYSLGRKVIPTTEPYDNIERAALTAEGASNMVAKIMERLTNSESLYEYNLKKQLLANAADKAVEEGLYTVIAAPSDTTTSEAFIKQIKSDVESASFASENTSLSKALIGAAPSLTLYVKKGVMPVVQVDALAGAFHAEDLALPANVKVVDTLPTTDTDVYAMLVDSRGIKLHTGYRALREQLNAAGDFMNFFYHTEFTGFISKFTYIKVYKAA